MAMKQTLPIICFFLFQTLILIANGADVAAPAPSMDCSSVLVNMADCLTFVENGSTIAKPEKTCCSGLKQAVKQNVECLCKTFKNSQDFGISLDVTKALSLPSACNVKTPPFSKCNISLPGNSLPEVPHSSPPSKAKNFTIPGEVWPVFAPAPQDIPHLSFGAQLKISPLIFIACVAAAILLYRDIIY